MKIKKIGARWMIDKFHRGTRYRLRSPGTTRLEAEAFAARICRELALHGTLDHLDEIRKPEKPSVPTLATFAESWMRDYAVENKRSERRAKEAILRVALRPAFGAWPLNEITAQRVQQFKREQLEKKLSAKTINNRLTVLRRLLRSALEWGVIETVPLITPLKVTAPPFRYLSVDEVRRLANAASTPLIRAMVVCAAHTGLRLGELCGLSWDDIDFARRQLCVRRNFVDGELETPKTRRMRYVPLTPDVVRELSALPRIGEAVFLFRGHRVIDVTAEKWLHRAADTAGIQHLGWHVLRHTFASELVSRGVPLAVVRDLLGHTTIRMTEKYAHLAPGPGHRAVGLLSLYADADVHWHPIGTAPTLAPQSAWWNAPDFPSFFAQETQSRALADAA